jgi:hypothetical protein
VTAKHTLNVRLTTEERAALAAAAKERCVSMNLLAGYAIRDFLRRLVPVDELLRTEPAPSPSPSPSLSPSPVPSLPGFPGAGPDTPPVVRPPYAVSDNDPIFGVSGDEQLGLGLPGAVL